MPTLKELCELVAGEIAGDASTEITGVASLENAGPGELAAIENQKYLPLAAKSQAAAFLVPRSIGEGLDRPCIFADFPQAALNVVIESFGLHVPRPAPGVHPTAVIDPGAMIGEGCHVGPYAVVQAGAVVGARCVLGPHVVIEGDVVIGDDCVFEPGAVIHNGARLGNRVHLGACAVISRQGFGFAPSPKGPVKLHHVGLTVLEDDVHIGAGTTVDRARFDETRIGTMSALDNQIQVGHNSTVGERTFIASQTGLAGNSHIGDDCEVGGQVGLANLARVGNRCRVAAKSGIMGDWAEGTTMLGYPAFEKTEFFRMLGALRKLGRQKKR